MKFFLIEDSLGDMHAINVNHIIEIIPDGDTDCTIILATDEIDIEMPMEKLVRKLEEFDANTL